MVVGLLERALLTPMSNVHGGAGEIFFRSVWGARDFQSNLAHLHHLVLPPKTSLGYFMRQSIEEVFGIRNCCVGILEGAAVPC